MPVPTLISELSQTPGSNFPLGSESPSVVDDYFRTYAAFIAQHRDGKGYTSEATLASAATADIGAQNSFFVQITGTTTITSFGTNYNGPRYVRFAGALTLTHNATTLILPGGANITTAAGDRAILTPVGNPASGWQVLAYEKADGSPVAYGLVPIANGGTGQTTAAGIQSILPIGQTRVDVASAATVDLTTTVPSNSHINITGTTTITGFTVASGRLLFVRFNAVLTLTNGAGLVTQTGQNIITQAGATCILRATSANVVEVLNYTSPATQSRATSGYQVLSGGLIVQWGTSSIGNATAVSFPVAFPSSVFSLAGSVDSGAGGNRLFSYSGLVTSGFVGYVTNGAGTFFTLPVTWVAFGY